MATKSERGYRLADTLLWTAPTRETSLDAIVRDGRRYVLATYVAPSGEINGEHLIVVVDQAFVGEPGGPQTSRHCATHEIARLICDDCGGSEHVIPHRDDTEWPWGRHDLCTDCIAERGHCPYCGAEPGIADMSWVLDGVCSTCAAPAEIEDAA